MMPPEWRMKSARCPACNATTLRSVDSLNTAAGTNQKALSSLFLFIFCTFIFHFLGNQISKTKRKSKFRIVHWCIWTQIHWCRAFEHCCGTFKVHFTVPIWFNSSWQHSCTSIYLTMPPSQRHRSPLKFGQLSRCVDLCVCKQEGCVVTEHDKGSPLIKKEVFTCNKRWRSCKHSLRFVAVLPFVLPWAEIHL